MKVPPGSLYAGIWYEIASSASGTALRIELGWLASLGSTFIAALLHVQVLNLTRARTSPESGALFALWLLVLRRGQAPPSLDKWLIPIHLATSSTRPRRTFWYSQPM